MVDQAKKQQAVRLIARGVAALKARDMQRARQFLLEARKLDPENTDALLWLTSTTRDTEQRRAILEQVLRINPAHPQALRALAKLEGLLVSPAQPEAVPPVQPEVTSDEAGQAPDAAGESAPEVESEPGEESIEAVVTVDDTEAVEEPAIDVPEPIPSEDVQDVDISAPASPSSLLSRLESATEETEAAAAPALPEALPEETLEAVDSEPEAALEAVVEVETPAEPEAPPAEPEPAPAVTPVSTPVPVPAPTDLRPPSVQEMATPAEAGRCPQCGAVMRIREGTSQAYCVFCGYGMEGDVETTPAVTSAVPEQSWPEARASRHCLNCGTHSIPPGGSQEVTPCPLCQQIIFEPSEILAAPPDVCLPFKLNEAEAAIAIEDEARGGLRRLLGSKVEMTRPRRVLLPVWVFNGKGQIDPGQGTERFTETYRLVPVHTLPQMDSQLLRVASAVPFEDVQPYRPEAIQGSYVLLPSQPLQACIREVRTLIERDAREKAQTHLRKTGALRNTGLLGARPVEIQDLVQRLVLLPVWINETWEGGRLRAGMVNAYTGAVVIGNMVHRQHGR